jgi:mannose-6-phosphate isomerase-like protein (cupin superfamily)
MSTDRSRAGDATAGGTGRLSSRRLVAGRLSEQVPPRGETFYELTVLAGARIEHIVSSATPDPALQIQDWDEWVLVLAGAAELEVSGERVHVTAGEWMVLPAGTPHRVLTTAVGTHWLAVHAFAQPAARP